LLVSKQPVSSQESRLQGRPALVFPVQGQDTVLEILQASQLFNGLGHGLVLFLAHQIGPA